MSELRRSTKRALIWSALDKGGQQILLTLVAIVTLRLLDSEAYGLVTPLALFTVIANILTEGGLATALIRKVDAGERDYNTAFWYNLVLGVLFYVLLFFASPWIARYNNLPELTLIARVQFLSIVFYALSLIPSTRLIKQSDFRRLGIANIVSVLFGGATVLVLALLGYGVWALVGQFIAQAFSRMTVLWILAPWKPRLMYSWQSFWQMFGFSSRIIAGSLASNISANFYASALGRYLPVQQLGFYGMANKAKETGAGFLTHIFGYSIYLMLCNLQDDLGAFRQAFRKSVRTISFVLFPTMLGLAVVSPALIEVVIGSKWLPAVPYIQILVFSGIFFVLNYFYGNALKARGRSDVTLVLDIANAVLLVSFLYLTIRYGLEVALVADVAAKLMVFLAYAGVSHWILGYRFRDQFFDLLPYAGLALAMAALAWLPGLVIHHPALLLLTQITVGALFYIGINRLLGSKVQQEVWHTLKNRKL